jgi:hypothetical protein
MNYLLPPERRADSDRRSFERVVRVLDGEAPPLLTGRASKLLCLLTSQRVDAVLTAASFSARLAGVSHRLHHYYLQDAPAALGFLLRAAGVSRVASTVAVAVSARVIEDVPGFTAWTLRACSVWVARERESVRFSVRDDSVSVAGGMWPELYSTERPSPEPPRWRELVPARRCPHCGEAVERARELTGALVCPHCARSFEERRALRATEG